MDPLRDNPFFVLGLPPTATSMEIERQGKKLLGMLELGLAGAQTFVSPFGVTVRTPELVRAAVHTLLDPARRLPFEPWAAWTPPASPSTTTAPPTNSSTSTSQTSTATSTATAALLWWNP